jgi:type IV pilus assembly protein PilA
MARRLLGASLRMSNVQHRTKRAARIVRAARVARAARRAFTLIELMIVVAIVGILAVIAVVGYRKLVLAAKVTEARNVISGARIAQEGYRTERGVYANIGASPLCPLASSGTGQFKTGWDPACGGGPTWAALPIHVDGPVQFGYATVAGSTALPTTIGQPTAFVTVPVGVGTDPWYYVTASADLDGLAGPYTELVGSSWSNQIFVANEGL